MMSDYRQYMAIMMRLITGLCLFVSSLTAYSQSEFALVVKSYSNLHTVAGRGWIATDGVNGWTPNMEGGNATDAELSRPHMTMADAAGNLYIADKCGHAIRRVETNGTIHTIAGTGVAGYNGDGAAVACQLNNPNGLFTRPDGTTYILDTDNGRIRKLTTDGQLTTILKSPGGISGGRGLWVSSDQSVIYYCSGTVVRKWTTQAGLTNYATGFGDLGNIDVDPRDGTLAVTDMMSNRVYRVYSDGSRAAIAGNGLASGGGDGYPALETGLWEARGICFAANGGYYLATQAGSQIWYVDLFGTIHLLIDGAVGTHAGDGQPLSTPGRKISEPRSVTRSPRGDLIITENDAGFIRVADARAVYRPKGACVIIR